MSSDHLEFGVRKLLFQNAFTELGRDGHFLKHPAEFAVVFVYSLSFAHRHANQFLHSLFQRFDALDEVSVWDDEEKRLVARGHGVEFSPKIVVPGVWYAFSVFVSVLTDPRSQGGANNWIRHIWNNKICSLSNKHNGFYQGRDSTGVEEDEDRQGRFVQSPREDRGRARRRQRRGGQTRTSRHAR